VGRINVAAGVGAASYLFTAWMLPPKKDQGYRRWLNRETFEVGITGVEGANVARNCVIKAGLRF
jgi:hypothetical protein